MATAVSPVMSDMFYARALGFDFAFTLEDVTPGANAERVELAQRWLAELVARGELRRLDRRFGRYYEWVNT